MAAGPQRGMRKGARTNPFRVALAISVIFHLSMVTVFSIVIYFPRNDIQYIDFQLVQMREIGLRPPGGRLRLSSGLDGAGEFELGARGLMADPGLSDFHLPTIEFAELHRLRLSEESKSRYDEVRRQQAPDSWGRFTRTLHDMRLSLSILGLGGDAEEVLGPSGPWRIQDPAPGFEAYIEWSTQPKNRPLASARPIRALEGVDPALLERPLVLVLKVNAEGRVVNVWSPRVDAHGLIDTVQVGVLGYRFAPLDKMGLSDALSASEQMATLRIYPKRGAP